MEELCTGQVVSISGVFELGVAVQRKSEEELVRKGD